MDNYLSVRLYIEEAKIRKDPSQGLRRKVSFSIFVHCHAI